MVTDKRRIHGVMVEYHRRVKQTTKGKQSGPMPTLPAEQFLSGVVKNNHIYYSFMQFPHLYQSINIYAAVSLNRLPENIQYKLESSCNY